MKRTTLYSGKIIALITVAILSILAGCTGTSSTPTATPISTLTPTPIAQANQIPPEVAQYARDWPLPNRDYSQTRATKDSTINSSNVNTLGVAWAYPVPGTGLFGSLSTSPIIMGKTVYCQDLGNNIFALDLASGSLKWKKIYNEANVGPNGVAVGWGKIFATIDPYNIAALDINTGNQLWSAKVSDNPTAGTDIQPTVYGGLVYTSTVPGSSGGDFYSGGGIGTIYAIDQATGKIVWSWDTVDSKDIWGNKDINSGGGCWYPPAIDASTNIMYWGIANPAPWPGTIDFPNGSSRPGPNLYTDSMVALSQNDGKLQWYTQVYPHDNLDLDFQISPVLTTATIGGVKQDIVIGAGKLGRVYAFNRKTGAILWAAIVGTHQNDQLVNLPSSNTTRVYPGSLGGIETPIAYSDGIVYVPVVNRYVEYSPSASVNSQPFNESTGELVAIQVDTGKILWDKNLNSPVFSGATVVNDVIFTATFDGTIYAFKTNTGDQLWSYKIAGGVNSWPSVAGDTLLWPCGLGSVPALVAFKLGANTPVAAITPADGSSISAGDVNVAALALNFNLVNKLGQTNAAGEGHIHYFMDVDAPTSQGKPAVTSAGTYTEGINTSYTWKNVAPGTHTFSVELVNNDHTPLNSPVVARSTVTVTPPAPSAIIQLPLNRATVPAGSINVLVKVSNFNLVNKLGQTNSQGEGHIHYFLDAVAPIEPGKPAVTATGTYAATAETSYSWANVKPGTHTLSVELVNNDHTPLTPPVVAKVTIVVSTTAGSGGP